MSERGRRNIPGGNWLIIVLLSGGIMNLISCNEINPQEPVPAYIHIDSISVSANYPVEGSSSSRISDAWIFVDHQYLGTYELPATFPVIGEGAHVITVHGGVIVNGMESNRTSYPFYTLLDTTILLQPQVKNQLNPVLKYFPSTHFPQIEDFDDGSISMVNTGGGTATLNITLPQDSNAFELNSGTVMLDSNHPVFEVASSDSFQLPPGVPVFVELNYKGDAEFTVGEFVNFSLGGVQQLGLLNVRTSSTWKKIYINLSGLGGVVSSGAGYKIFLHANLPTGTSSARLYFDNLKVVY